MHAAAWWMYAWPGLPLAWRRGDWWGLAVAVGFAVLLNAVVLATLGWSEVVSTSTARLVWAVVGTAWGAGVWFTWHIGRNPSPSGEDGTGRDLFPAAISEYLQGNWFEAEAACQQLLSADDHDVDAHLLLATLLRHTGRFDEARRRLELVATLEGSGKWAWEIAAEWHRLGEAQAQQEEAGRDGLTVENLARKAA